MTEFLDVLPPDEAQKRWLTQVTHHLEVEMVRTMDALNRVTADAVRSPEALPAFRRATVDGYAVRASDTFGASETLPAYLTVAGEVLMGQSTEIDIIPGAAALIHTGGMVPAGADAIVMVENTQAFGAGEIEVRRPVAVGENVLMVGEDVQPGATILDRRYRIRPQDIGALLALGLVDGLPVVKRPRVAIFSTGDELVAPEITSLNPGQIRDINSAMIGALSVQVGADPITYPIVPDQPDALYTVLVDALADADMVVVTAGSSVSVRDMTAQVINRLGKPGVLVHGVAARPGKPTILAVVHGKPIIGLPGNPVSAFVMFMLFGLPAIAHLLDTAMPFQARTRARAAANIASAAGREDYIPVRLETRDGEIWAEPLFGKSNLIFQLVGADGLFEVPLDTTGLREGSWGEVVLF